MFRNPFHTFGLVLLLGLCVSCGKEPRVPAGAYGSAQVAFLAQGAAPSASLVTKADAVGLSDLDDDGFLVSCVNGAEGSDVQVWGNTLFSKSGIVWTGGKIWPLEDRSYRFYAVHPESYALTVSPFGATVAASTSDDIVVAYASDPVYKGTNALVFSHIFSRIGTVTVTAGNGYTVTGVSIRVVPKTGGTYNLRTGEWSSLSEGSAVAIASGTGANANDLYLVPGTYEVLASWTAATGAYSETFTDCPVVFTAEAGHVATLAAELDGRGISLSVSSEVADWDSADLLEDNPAYMSPES